MDSLKRYNQVERRRIMEEEDRNAHLTEEQREQVRRATTGYGEQGANGYDLSMFRANLRLTPTERIQKMQRALILSQEVARAGREHRLSKRNCTSS